MHTWACTCLLYAMKVFKIKYLFFWTIASRELFTFSPAIDVATFAKIQKIHNKLCFCIISINIILIRVIRKCDFHVIAHKMEKQVLILI